MKIKKLVSVSDWALSYVVEGFGMPTIVIGSSLYYSRTFSQNLRSKLQMVFMNHRGFVQPPENVDISTLTLDTFIEDIEKVRQAVGFKKVVIIGHSGHGYMALEYAKKYPQFTSHVVLIGMGPNQSGASHDAANQYFNDTVCPQRKAVFEENMQKLPAEIAAHPERRFITFALRFGARSWYNYNFDATSLWQGITVNMPIFDYMWGDVFRDIDITKGLEALDMPVFLGLGVYDYLVAPFYTWNPIRDKFKNLTVKLFDKSGHTPQFEEPELFDQELVRWLDENPIRSNHD